jgi:hypothetical protein
MTRFLLFSCVVCLFSATAVNAQAPSAPQEPSQLATLLEQQTS